VANIGGDLRVLAPQRGWTVAAEGAGGRTTVLELEDAGLATSGLGHRRWAGGHHIIDPRTGRAAQTCWDSVSVLAARAAGANAASTAAVVLGGDAPSWLQERGLDAWCTAGDREAMVGRWPLWREPARSGAYL
jgi:thiamine biosynthesis lipoprotein